MQQELREGASGKLADGGVALVALGGDLRAGRGRTVVEPAVLSRSADAGGDVGGLNGLRGIVSLGRVVERDRDVDVGERVVGESDGGEEAGDNGDDDDRDGLLHGVLHCSALSAGTLRFWQMPCFQPILPKNRSFTNFR